MHLVSGRELLTQQADGHLRDGQGVLRIDPLPGRRRGVGLASREVGLVVRHGEADAREVFRRPGVHHHGRVDAREGATLEHQHLAAPALLGRRAEHAHAEPEVVRHGGQRQPGPDSRGGNDVVPARVPDVGQRVILGAHGHDQLSVTTPGLECGRQVVDALAHGEATGA